MRKCDACGYLAMGAGDACKHCGTVLPAAAPAALVTSGAPAPVPASRPPVPAPVGAPAPSASPVFPPVVFGAPPAPPQGIGRTPFTREYASAPNPPTPPARTRSTPRALIALIAAVAMACGWIAVGHVLHDDPIPAGTSAFVAGHGVAYSSPDHTFDAQFPITPTVERRVIPVASTAATLNLAQAQTDDYEVVAASLVLPVAVPPNQVDQVLHEILNEGAASQGAKIVSETHVVRDGVPGLEVRAKIRDGYDARFMALSSGNRLYMLGVHAEHGTRRLYDALVASLLIS